MDIAFHTLGCKVNQYETEAMKEQFTAAGHRIVGEEDPADVYIINTCTVTNLADRKSRQYIRRMKAQCPEAVVAVTGCYAQVSPEDLMAMDEVDIVTGNGEKDALLTYVETFCQDREKQKHVLSYDQLTAYQDSGVITSMESRTRAYLKIEEGCDRFCAYCLIPYARGHVRSRNPAEIVEEAKALIAAGFKELILTGINTALYGTEPGFVARYGKAMRLPDAETNPTSSGIVPLIALLNALPGEFRLRLSSLEPTVVNAGYVRQLFPYEKLCHHLHLSVQSGSDRVLKLMNRHYDRQAYLEIVKTLRDFDPGYGITTDIIVGFPGEQPEDFADSLRMVREAGFGKVHGFRYSKRPKTAAAKMKEQVSGEVKNQRITKLLTAGEAAASEFLQGCARRQEIRTVLFEERDADGWLVGYSDNYIRVRALGPETMVNRFQKVKLLEIEQDGMKGEIVNG